MIYSHPSGTAKGVKIRRIGWAILLAASVQILFFWAISAIKPQDSLKGFGDGTSDAISVSLGQNATSAAPEADAVATPAPATDASVTPVAAPITAPTTPGGGGETLPDDPYIRASVPKAASDDKAKLAGNIPAQVKVCWVRPGAGDPVKLSITLNDNGAVIGAPIASGSADPAALAAAITAAKDCAPYALGPAPGILQTFEVELGGR